MRFYLAVFSLCFFLSGCDDNSAASQSNKLSGFGGTPPTLIPGKVESEFPDAPEMIEDAETQGEAAMEEPAEPTPNVVVEAISDRVSEVFTAPIPDPTPEADPPVPSEELIDDVLPGLTPYEY